MERKEIKSMLNHFTFQRDPASLITKVTKYNGGSWVRKILGNKIEPLTELWVKEKIMQLN